MGKYLHFVIAMRQQSVRIKRANPVCPACASPLARTARPVGAQAVNSGAQQRMRILLQQKQNGLYFKDVGSWTRISMEAMDFVSSTAAIDFCAVNKLSGVQLVLKFDEQKYDIVLPMLPPRDFATERPSP